MSEHAAKMLQEARELRKRATALDRIVSGLRASAIELEEHAARLSNPNATGDSCLLRGRRIGEEAAGVVGIGEVAHYTAILDALTARGFVVSGSPPHNNIIAQLSRDPHFEQVGNRTGLYRRTT